MKPKYRHPDSTRREATRLRMLRDPRPGDYAATSTRLPGRRYMLDLLRGLPARERRGVRRLWKKHPRPNIAALVDGRHHEAWAPDRRLLRIFTDQHRFPGLPDIVPDEHWTELVRGAHTLIPAGAPIPEEADVQLYLPGDGPEDEPIPVDDVDAWIEAVRDLDECHPNWRTLALTDLGEATVSTLFLAADARRVKKGPPALYQTVVFGGRHDGQSTNWPGRAAALAGHRDIVSALARRQLLDDTMSGFEEE
jgi:hypothetical protein